MSARVGESNGVEVTALDEPRLPASSSPENARASSGKPRQVWVDKNLAALGFFTPSSQRIKREKAKTVRFSQLVDRERVEVTATIVPSALHGLPVTADQDKFLALQEIVRAQRRGGSLVSNPVSFSSAALLRALGLCDSGRNHLDVSDWLDLMASTTIISEGAVYLAGSRRWARDRFRVFDRAVSRGRQLDDGTVAERNYVWFSSWQLENINGRHLLPIDLDVYQRLNTHIARALVLHLQIWLYASQRAQVFEKRYVDVCQLLGLRVYDHRSKIVEKLGPALEELTTNGYLSDWQVARTADDGAFKLVLKHGARFTGEPATAAAQISPDDPAPAPREAPASSASPAMPPADEPIEPDASAEPVDEALVAELTSRDVTTRRARRLLAAVPKTQDVLRQLEWGDFVIARAARGTFWNPAGFYVALVRDNLDPPEDFLSSREQRERDEARQKLVEDHTRRTRLNDAYRQYREEQAAAHLAAMDEGDLELALDTKAHELRSRFSSFSWTTEHLRSMAQTTLRSEIAARLPLLDFQSFVFQMSGNGEAQQDSSEEAPCAAASA